MATAQTILSFEELLSLLRDLMNFALGDSCSDGGKNAGQ
jgi:hypothetical protein